MDNLHEVNAVNEGIFDKLALREAGPKITVSEPPAGEDKERMESEEEVDQNESRNMSSRNDTEHMLGMNKKSSKIMVGCNCIKSKCTKNYC